MKHIFAFLVINFLFFSPSFSQSCPINKMFSHYLSFENSGLVGKFYDHLKNTDENDPQICIIEASGYTANCFCLKLEAPNRLVLTRLNDSFLEKTWTIIIDSGNYNKILGNLNIPDSLYGYYGSACANRSSQVSHTVIIRNQNHWLEYTSMNTPLNEILFENKNYKMLVNVVQIIEKYFDIKKF